MSDLKGSDYTDDVSFARDLILSILKAQNALTLNAPDIGPGVTIRHLIDPEGWLPFIMMRSDELSTLLTGKKLWECAYISDASSLHGICVKAINEMGGQSIEKEGLPEVPARSNDIGLVSLIHLGGLNEAITIKGGDCQLNPLPSQYFINGTTQEGAVIQPIPENFHYMTHLNNIAINYRDSLLRALESAPELGGLN